MRRAWDDFPCSRTLVKSLVSVSRAVLGKRWLTGSGFGVSCEVDLDTFWKQAFAAMATAAVQDGPTGFGLHTGAETELLLARALGRLISAFHILKIGVEMLRVKFKASIQKICHAFDLHIKAEELRANRGTGRCGLGKIAGVNLVHFLEVFHSEVGEINARAEAVQCT